MYIDLKRLKLPEIRKLAMKYNELKKIPHPSTLKKGALIRYLKEKLGTNEKGHVLVNDPELKKSIKSAINRMKKEYDESKKKLMETIENIEKEIKPKLKEIKERETFIPFRDTLTQKQRDESDRRFKYFLETGRHLPTQTSKK